MAHLRKTTKEKNHDHIVYIRDFVENLATGTKLAKDIPVGIIGFSSRDEGHIHEIRYSPPRDEVVDPNTGQVVEPAQPEKIIIVDNDKHTHELAEILTVDFEKRKRKEKNKDELKRYSEYLQVYCQAVNDDEFYIKQANISEGMYFGDGQWDPNVRKQLQEQKRPAITINKIGAKINALSGDQFQNSVSFKASPKEEGDLAIADIINGLNYHFLARNNYPHTQNEVFNDIAIGGRGSYIVRADFSKNLEGDILIERAPWDDVFYLAHDKKDASDCEGVAFCRWITEKRLKFIAPEDKLEEIESVGIFQSINFDDYDGFTCNLIDNKLINIDGKRVKLVQVQKKEYTKRSAIAHVDDNYYLDGMEGRIPSWLLSKKEIDQVLTIPGFIKIDRIVEEIWVGTFAGTILLSDMLSPLSGFNYIPGYGTKRKQRVKGKVYDLFDPARENNKIRSIIHEIMSKMSAKGVYYDETIFNNPDEEELFVQNRAIPGFIIKVADVSKVPVEENGATIPSDLVGLSNVMEQDLTEISGINEELLGVQSTAQSTPLFIEKRNAARIANEHLHQGLEMADRELGFRLMELYRLLLTPERVYKILENTDRKLKGDGGLIMDNIPFAKYDEAQIRKLWESVDISQYHIAITEGPNSPTKRAADARLWADLGKQGLPGVNAEFLLNVLDVPPDQKERLSEISSQTSRVQNEIESKRLSIEENKTFLAAQSREKIALAEIQSRERIERAKLEKEYSQLAVDSRFKAQESKLQAEPIGPQLQ